MKEIHEILIAPHVTEETMKNMVNPRNDVHKYVFKVALDASKDDIKAAIEARLFAGAWLLARNPTGRRPTSH